jgi:hypothetical protein
MNTYTISRYRDAVKDPPPDGWTGGVLLEGDDYPTGAARLCGAFWADSGGEISPVQWLSENEPAIPKLCWDKLRERVTALTVKYYMGSGFFALSAVSKIMDELEVENEKEV